MGKRVASGQRSKIKLAIAKIEGSHFFHRCIVMCHVSHVIVIAHPPSLKLEATCTRYRYWYPVRYGTVVLRSNFTLHYLDV
jgi:hypothetical protein